jgi:hypothetical protein
VRLRTYWFPGGLTRPTGDLGSQPHLRNRPRRSQAAHNHPARHDFISAGPAGTSCQRIYPAVTDPGIKPISSMGYGWHPVGAEASAGDARCWPVHRSAPATSRWFVGVPPDHRGGPLSLRGSHLTVRADGASLVLPLRWSRCPLRRVSVSRSLWSSPGSCLVHTRLRNQKYYPKKG